MTTGWGPEDTTPARPGLVFPLRRMSLGEVVGGGFSMIRHAPKAVIGVPFAAGLVNFLLTLVLLFAFPTGDFFRLLFDPMAFEDEEMLFSVFSDVQFILTGLVVTVVQSFIMWVAFALVALPTLRAVYGFRTGFGQTLRLRSGRIAVLVVHLLVMSVFVVAIAIAAAVASAGLLVVTLFIGIIVVLPGVLLLMAWLTAGFMYAPMIVLVEDRGPFSAIARSWRLNRGRWWVNIGTVSLVYLMLFVMLIIASIPMSIAAAIGSEMALASPDPASGTTASMILFAVASLIDSLLTAVFIGLAGALVTVMYLNCRIHQESLDVALLAGAERVNDDGQMIPASIEHLGPVAAHPPAPSGSWGHEGPPPPWGQQGQPSPWQAQPPQYPPQHPGPPHAPWPQNPGPYSSGPYNPGPHHHGPAQGSDFGPPR